MEWAWQRHRTRGAVGGTGQDAEKKRARGTHSLEGADPGTGQDAAKDRACTLAEEDVDGTALMWTGQKTERKRATRLLERAEGGAGK